MLVRKDEVDLRKVEMDQGNEKTKASFSSKSCINVTSGRVCRLARVACRNEYVYVGTQLQLPHSRVSLWVHSHTQILCGQGKTLRAQLPLHYSPDSSPFFIAFSLFLNSQRSLGSH